MWQNCSNKVGRGEFEGPESASQAIPEPATNAISFAVGKKYKDWTVENWSVVIWSDESNIEIFGTSGAQFVHRKPGEAFRANCITPTVKHGRGSFMIWGCMSANGIGEMFVCDGRMNSERYIPMLEEVLEA
ncbi:hypothetical protein Trydic_g23741 [Trypoxylus dichotomus]